MNKNNNRGLNKLIKKNQLFNYKKLNLRSLKTIVDWHFFTNMVKYGWFFIVSSFLTSFLPIAICLIAGSIKFHGCETLMGIGLLSTFQIVFTNVGSVLGLTLAITLVKNKNIRSNRDFGLKDDYGIIATQFLVNFVVGIVMTGLYIGLSYLYITYNCNHPNLVLVKEEGLNFIWSSSPCILLNSWLALFIILIFKNRGNLLASFISLLNFIITISFICGFSFGTNLSTIGIGISIDISLIITLFIIILILLIHKEHHKLRNFRINRKEFKILLKNSYKVSFESSWRASTRGVVIIILSIISSSENQILPLNMIMAKILWFNMNFFLPYFGTGVSNALKYYIVYEKANFSYLDIKPFIIFILLTVLCNTITSAIWMASMPNIIASYISNMESLQSFAINNIGNPDFSYPQIWSKFPDPEWINNYPNVNLTGQGWKLYWVNLTVYGSNANGEASVMAMFWGSNQWLGPNYKPVFSVTIIFIILYHIFMISETLLTQITSLFLKKNKSFWVVILMHTLIMGFVLIFAYFTIDYLGIEAFVIPFMLFSIVTLSYTIFKFSKVYKVEKKSYYQKLNLTINAK